MFYFHFDNLKSELIHPLIYILILTFEARIIGDGDLNTNLKINRYKQTDHLIISRYGSIFFSV